MCSRFGLGVLRKRKVSGLRRKSNYDSPVSRATASSTYRAEQFVTVKGFGLLSAATLRPHKVPTDAEDDGDGVSFLPSCHCISPDR